MKHNQGGYNMKEEYNLTIMDLVQGKTYVCKRDGMNYYCDDNTALEYLFRTDRFKPVEPILAYKKLYAYRSPDGWVEWRTSLIEGLDRIHNFDIEVGK